MKITIKKEFSFTSNCMYYYLYVNDEVKKAFQVEKEAVEYAELLKKTGDVEEKIIYEFDSESEEAKAYYEELNKRRSAEPNADRDALINNEINL